MDCDMLVTDDIAKVFALADEKYAVMVVKHEHQSGVEVKMDAQVQTYYSRKNWSSVMLINCSHHSHVRLRSLNRINTWAGRDLHAFRWLEDDEIGELPHDWNHLIGVDEDGPASIYHYTLGTPNLPGYEDCSYADLWREALSESV